LLRRTSRLPGDGIFRSDLNEHERGKFALAAGDDLAIILDWRELHLMGMRFSRLEVTSGEWLEFINIFAPQSDAPAFCLRPAFSGIIDAGAGWGQYVLRSDLRDAAMVPVIGISWRDAAMYCNWLHKGILVFARLSSGSRARCDC